MKKFYVLIISLFCITASVFSQTAETTLQDAKRASISVGFLQGGGSLVGADLEYLVTSRFGVQAGAGFVGFGGGLNYHLKPDIRSSYISLQYWHQGFGQSFAQNVIGPNFVYRAKKWFTAQIGFGFPLSQGPALADYDQPSIMLMYSIGVYFPF